MCQKKAQNDVLLAVRTDLNRTPQHYSNFTTHQCPIRVQLAAKSFDSSPTTRAIFGLVSRIFGQVPDPADEVVTTDHPSPASNNAPTVIAPPAAEPANVPEEIVEESKTDPGAIREELKRRQETSE